VSQSTIKLYRLAKGMISMFIH